MVNRSLNWLQIEKVNNINAIFTIYPAIFAQRSSTVGVEGDCTVNGVTEFVKAMGPARLAAMGAVAAILIGFFAFIMLRMNTPNFSPIFTDLTLTDSGQVVKELEKLGTKYEIRNDGATIMVPKADIPRLRMKLAEGGLPKGGGVGYELFDKGETLGSTSFVQNLNHLRALEGELARSIRSIDRVQGARVHLVIPERAVFSRDKQDPTASIVLKVRGTIDQAQVKAIQHLVASAVPSMKPTSVSIIDEAGRLLASGKGDDITGQANGMDERSVLFERRMQGSVEEILTRIVGPGRARVQVAAEMDWNRTTQTQDLFDPEGRVIRSTQTRGEKNQSQEPRDRAVTVGNELPGATGAAAGDKDGFTKENGEKNEEIVNYEISRTTRTEVVEAGRVKRLSVAVLVDGVYSRKGESLVYEARAKDDLERIAALVRSAIGFNEQRGDKVEVVNLRFAEAPPPQALDGSVNNSIFDFKFAEMKLSKDDVLQLVETVILLILGVLMLLFVIRPLMKRAFGPSEEEIRAAKEVALAATQEAAHSGAVAHAADGTQVAEGGTRKAGVTITEADGVTLQESATSRAFEVAAITGQMHAESVDKIGALVRTNPNEATAIIRAWMNEAQAA